MQLQRGLDRERQRAWVYHPKDSSMDKQVYIEEKNAYLLEGWLKSPADRGKKKPEVEQQEPQKVEKKDPIYLMDAPEIKQWFDENKPEVKYFKNAQKKSMLKLYETVK